MEVQLTVDQQAFARQAIESGRLHREEDAVMEALSYGSSVSEGSSKFPRLSTKAEASLACGEGPSLRHNP